VGDSRRPACAPVAPTGQAESRVPVKPVTAQARSKNKQIHLIVGLLDLIARSQVPKRPDRREPRAVKRRPKTFPLLNKPPDQRTEVCQRNRYWKSSPGKSSV
jgi:hypothetical protein